MFIVSTGMGSQTKVCYNWLSTAGTGAHLLHHWSYKPSQHYTNKLIHHGKFSFPTNELNHIKIEELLN